jgi:hypothetical protein
MVKPLVKSAMKVAETAAKHQPVKSVKVKIKFEGKGKYGKAFG